MRRMLLNSVVQPIIRGEGVRSHSPSTVMELVATSCALALEHDAPHGDEGIRFAARSALVMKA